MKRNIKNAVFALLAASVLTASCGCDNGGKNVTVTSASTKAPGEAPIAELSTTAAHDTNETATSVTEISENETDTSATEPNSEEPTEEISIENGVWWCRSAEETSGAYYLFNNGKGSFIAQYNGVNMDYTYEQNGFDIVFQFGSSGEKSPARITDVGTDMIHLRFENNGETLVLKHISDDADKFVFFNTVVITEAATAYYTSSHDGVRPETTATDLSEDDYIELRFDGSAGETIYYIDPLTGKGYTSMGEAVDLGLASAGGIEDMSDPIRPTDWSPLVVQRQVMLDENDFFGVKYLGYIDPDANDFDVYGSYINNILALTGTSEDFPFTSELPRDRFVSSGNGTELYLVIPYDEVGNVTVIVQELTDDGLEDTRIIYRSEDGQPFLLKCNVSEIFSDVKVIIGDRNGKYTEWRPSISGENGTVVTSNSHDLKCYDFTDYKVLAKVDNAPVG